ncbi:MAG TPA: LppC family lipoprotein, partial [Marinobacter hydrocarbonoclasticus]|nr:LppC family lipoprotein [Marinobacter nauticus]
MTNRFRHSPILALITLVLFYLGGCATVNLDEHMAQSPEQALSLASDERDPVVGQRYLLRVASRFQDQGRHEDARVILQAPVLENAPEDIARQRSLLSMASASELQDSQWAEQLATDSTPESFLAYPAELMSRAAM